MITGKNHIGYQLSALGNRTFKTFNPQQNIENSWTFTEANEAEIHKAVALAKQAFQTYQHTTRELNNNVMYTSPVSTA